MSIHSACVCGCTPFHCTLLYAPVFTLNQQSHSHSFSLTTETALITESGSWKWLPASFLCHRGSGSDIHYFLTRDTGSYIAARHIVISKLNNHWILNVELDYMKHFTLVWNEKQDSVTKRYLHQGLWHSLNFTTNSGQFYLNFSIGES